MGFWDYLEIVVFIIMLAYLVVTGMRLLKGGDAHISGYSTLTEADKACYDEKRLKQAAGIGNLTAAVGTALILASKFSGQIRLAGVGLILFLLGFGVPYQLLKRSQYFIKK